MAQMDKQIQYYEDEIRVLREQIANGPRNFTDKSVTSAEYQDMRLKVCCKFERTNYCVQMEKMENELTHRQSEMQSAVARAQNAEEQLKETKRNFTIIKESNSAKEAQISLLHSDVCNYANIYTNKYK